MRELVEDTSAAISSGGNSFGPTALADFGASVTGEARPFEKMETSSGFIRSAEEDRSSLRGKAGR